MVKVKNRNEKDKNIFGKIIKADVRINYHDDVNFHFWLTENKRDYYFIVYQIINEEVINMSDNCGKNTCKILQKMFHSNMLPVHWKYFKDERFSMYFFTENTMILPYRVIAEIRISDFDDIIEFIIIENHKKYIVKTTIKQIMNGSDISRICV